MNEIFVYGSIVDDEDATSDDVTCPKKFRRALASIGDSKNLTVHINSAGGSVPAGCSMANMLASRKGNTTAIVDGICCSIATQIFFSADQCLMPENTFLYIHKPTTSTSGNEDEMTSAAKTLSAIQRGLEAVYRRKAKVPPEKITEMMNAETWLTAEEAAQYFNITVISPSKSVNVVDMSILKNIPDQAKMFDKNSRDRQRLKEMLDEIDRYRAPWTKKEDERKDEKMTMENENVLAVRAFNKMLVNTIRTVPVDVTDAEKRAYFNVSGSPGSPGLIETTGSRGGYLVPPEKQRQLLEYRQLYTALKDLTHVVPVTSPHGDFPRLPKQNLEYVPFAELSAIQESSLDFEHINFTVSDRGLIIPISNQLLEDADFDVIDICGRELSRAAINTENKVIIEQLQSKIDGATIINDWQGLTKALFKDLDSAYAASANIVTNQSGFWWLSTLVDGDNRPLLVPDVTAKNSYSFRGVPIITLPDAVLPCKVTNAYSYAPFLIGDFYSALLFFERRGFSLSLSTEYLFSLNAAALRSVLRLDCVLADSNALVAVTVKI